MVERLLENGEKLVATLRKPEAISHLSAKYGAEQLLVLKLDVTKKQEVTDAFKKAREHFGRIDIVFSNAGLSILGEVEGTAEESARYCFEASSNQLH